MHYCGVAVAESGHLQLATLQEVREPEPPIRLAAAFYEPGSSHQVAAEIQGLEDVVVGVSAPMSGPAQGGPARRCDELLAARGVPALEPAPEAARLFELVAGMGLFAPDAEGEEGTVDEGAYHGAAVFETNADGIFCSLQARRLPAKRHPFGMQLRIHELEEDHVVDDGGGLWQRRVEEVEAAGAALCAHRYAVGHACWLGAPAEGVLVLPGSSLPERFETAGVLTAVERVLLPGS
jgi:predicted nuclease with RNAse H fold